MGERGVLWGWSSLKTEMAEGDDEAGFAWGYKEQGKPFP